MTTQTIAEAETALADARARRNQLAADHAATSSTLTAALAARSALVTAAAEGNPPADAAHRKVEGDIHATRNRAGLLQDAVAEADAAITTAERGLHLARQAEWEGRMAAAIEGRVTAAGRLDQAVAAAREALAAYASAGTAINDMIREGVGYRTRFHHNVGGHLAVRGAVMRLELELTTPDGIGGRKPFHAGVETLERGGWGMPAQKGAA